MAALPTFAPTFAEATAFRKPKGEESTRFTGWYVFAHPGGEFEVCLRPGGVFYAPDFPSGSRWCVLPTGGDSIGISWGKYGNYELRVTQPAPLMALEGAAVPPVEGDQPGPGDWRKMRFTRPLSAVETTLLGPTGGGTEWAFEYASGRFSVQFRGDGYNHFHCQQYQAHSHWKLGGAAGDEVTISWGQYGTYVMKVAGRAASGHAAGNPADWRKMRWIRDLEAAEAKETCPHPHDGSSLGDLLGAAPQPPAAEECRPTPQECEAYCDMSVCGEDSAGALVPPGEAYRPSVEPLLAVE